MVGVLIPEKSASTTNQGLAFTEMVSQHMYASWYHMENFWFFFYHIGFSFWVFLTFLFILLPKHSISVYSFLNTIHFNTIRGFFFNWSIVDLQCCVSFWCRAEWFSYTHPYRLLQDIKYSSKCHSVWQYFLLVYHLYSSLNLLIPNCHLWGRTKLDTTEVT